MLRNDKTTVLIYCLTINTFLLQKVPSPSFDNILLDTEGTNQEKVTKPLVESNNTGKHTMISSEPLNSGIATRGAQAVPTVAAGIEYCLTSSL